MAAFLMRRSAAAIALILLVLTVAFVVIHLAPGGPEKLYLDPRMDQRDIDRLVALYGLDRPLPERYLKWLKAVVIDWDWGISVRQAAPVGELLLDHAPATLWLAGAALLVQFALGTLLGVTSARHAERLPDHLIRIVSVVLYSLPAFWLGLMALLLLSYTFPIFPSGHTHGPDVYEMSALGAFANRLYHLALPALVLGLGTLGAVVRLLRGSLVEVLQEDYVRTARAKGVSEAAVLWVHGLRNAAGPLTQLFGLSLPFLVSGALVVELVFSWPGIGQLTWLAISSRDYPVLLATTALGALFVVLGTTAADVLLAVIDPRVRHAG